MTLARVKVWANGETLNAPDLNAEFDSLIQNPISLLSPLVNSLDFANFDAVNFTLENLVTVPAGVSTGRLYYFPALQAVFLDDGTPNIRLLGPQTVGHGSVSGLTGSIVANIGSFAAKSYSMRRPTQAVVQGVTATSSFSIDTQLAGPIANGRDQAAVFASTEVHFYALTTGPFSTAPAGVVSSKPPTIGPALPGFYSAWTYLCSAKYDTNTSQAQFPVLISGSQASFTTPLLMVNSTGNTTEGNIAVSGWVPSPALRYSAIITEILQGASTGGLISGSAIVGPQSAVNFSNQSILGGSNSTASGSRMSGSFLVSVPVISTESTSIPLYYKNNILSGTSGLLTIQITDFTVPNGDV